MIEERQAARKARDFKRADEIRDELLAQGIFWRYQRGRKMETSITYLKEQFQLKDPDIRSYSPLTLAYIGDGIYELYIRTILIKQGNCQVNKLHKQASRLVKAQAQSEMVQVLEPHFTQEEEAVYKRGRNAKSYTTAKNATTGDYRRATGFEAVMGYLYLTDQYCRMIDLIKNWNWRALKDGK